ncbi:hypothetical protein BRC83_02965 [Halobacteriales archaeon QS_1_68_17]|nr:MAG: hypothetical protein BRC83_02965 [Halobacteriales archaeon QS_1_68_17]
MAEPESIVEIIVPNLLPEEAIDRVEPDEDVFPEEVGVVGRPRYLFDYDIRIERFLFEDRLVELSTTIDGLTGGGTRNDVYPDLEERSIPDRSLLETRLDQAEAEEKSRSIVRRHLNVQFAASIIVGNIPDIEVTRDDFAYALYWTVPTGYNKMAERTVTVVDSISGTVVETDVPADGVTAKLFMW